MRLKTAPPPQSVSRKGKKIQEAEVSDKWNCLATTLTRLQGLTIPKLRTLLQTYNVLCRSKLHKKAEMIAVLLPLIREQEIDTPNSVGNPKEVVQTPDVSPISALSTSSINDQKSNIIHGLVAKRYNTPVMGVDVHRDTLAFAIVDPQSVLVSGERENTEEGINELVHLCKKHKVEIVGMESTSEYWLPLHWAMQTVGIGTLVANPQQTKATQGVKTDPQDAQRIAFAIRDGRLKPSVVCTPEAYALRKNLREMVHQIDAATAVQNRLQQIFHKARAGKNIPKYLHSGRGSQILGGIVDCRTKDAVYQVVKAAYAQYKGKTTDPQRLQPIAQELWGFLERLDQLYDRGRFYELLEELYAHRARENELLIGALQYAKNHPTYKKNLQLLLSIPCVGLSTAVIVLAEIVDISLFPTVKNLTKWAGLVPRTNKSGFRKRSKGRLYKGGNRYLRRALWLAAQSDYQFGEEPSHLVGGVIRTMYVQKKAAYKQAITAGAHKLLRIVYGVLSTQQVYHAQSDLADQERLLRMTHRKLNVLDRAITTTPMVDTVPLVLERLQQTMKRVTDAKRTLELLYTEVYHMPLPEQKLKMEEEMT